MPNEAKAKKTSQLPQDVVAKKRGSATYFTNGAVEFQPDTESDKKLYQPLEETRNASLQKTENIYKVSLKADVDCTDPYSQLLKEFRKVTAPLLPKDAAPPPLEDAEVVGRTERSVVTKTEDEVIIVTRLPRREPNPDVLPLLPHLTEEQKQRMKLTLTPLELLTTEISKLCSVISTISMT